MNVLLLKMLEQTTIHIHIDKKVPVHISRNCKVLFLSMIESDQGPIKNSRRIFF